MLDITAVLILVIFMVGDKTGKGGKKEILSEFN
jgi:hypothetical protein